MTGQHPYAGAQAPGRQELLDSPAPPIEASEAARIAQRLFGIDGVATPLASERDTNFHLVARDGTGFALKFANPAEPPAITGLQTEALLLLERENLALPVPRVARALDGRWEIPLALPDGRQSIVRLLTWVEGEPVAKVGVSAAVRRDMGRMLAHIGTALAEFDHPAASHDPLWDIRNAARLRPMAAFVPEADMRRRVLAELDHFEAEVQPRLSRLRSQVVHNDLNHHNVVVRRADPARVTGVIDFGDMVRTALAIDVAVAASYLTSLDEDPVDCVLDLGAVEAIRAAGGLYVADEVQSGFGRTGDALWGFQRHSVRPDIVSMCKPMGNGYPVAALAVRPEVVERFGREARYFNTFGGNAVAAVAALAVLDAIRSDGLVENARIVGAYLKERIADLALEQPCIGEVRGAGLFVGVDIVQDRDPGRPDAGRAARIVNGLREAGVLISACAKAANVLNMRPPLILSRENADLLVEQVREVLGRIS